MLRWINGKTRRDRIRNDTIRKSVGVAPIAEKLVENRLRWFRHVERRLVDAIMRRVDHMGRVMSKEVDEDLGKLRETLGKI
jgi:hypothetical protein